MSVILKGMEMPYGCADCDFCGGIIVPDGIYYCDCPSEASHGKNISDAINNDTRADFCPLIELPSHGRLIAEKTIMEIRYHDADGYHIVNGEQLCELEIDADTVIEAEGEA